MSGDFGLETICRSNDLVIFDKSALFDTCRAGRIYDPKFEYFSRLLSGLPKRRIPQALWQRFGRKNRDQIADYMQFTLLNAFKGKTLGVGHAQHTTKLRKRVVRVTRSMGIAEENRYSIFLATACVRDTKETISRPTAYISCSSKNIEALNEVLERTNGVVPDKASAYLWNNEKGMYLPHVKETQPAQ